jgi:hypothetical protein
MSNKVNASKLGRRDPGWLDGGWNGEAKSYTQQATRNKKLATSCFLVVQRMPLRGAIKMTRGLITHGVFWCDVMQTTLHR